jgi:hypothetical protein
MVAAPPDNDIHDNALVYKTIGSIAKHDEHHHTSKHNDEQQQRRWQVASSKSQVAGSKQQVASGK